MAGPSLSIGPSPSPGSSFSSSNVDPRDEFEIRALPVSGAPHLVESDSDPDTRHATELNHSDNQPSTSVIDDHGGFSPSASLACLGAHFMTAALGLSILGATIRVLSSRDLPLTGVNGYSIIAFILCLGGGALCGLAAILFGIATAVRKADQVRRANWRKESAVSHQDARSAP